jgi:hypothetical protein
MDPEKGWVPKEFGRSLQRDDLSCASGTTQDNFINKGDTGILWIPEESDRCRQEDVTLCKSGMAKETLAERGTQQGYKEPRCWEAATPEEREENRQEYRGTEQKTAATIGNYE